MLENKDLKNTITAKLVELDRLSDGLSDYIVMMISNRKNYEYIRKDLEVFLAKDVDAFMTWLENYVSFERDGKPNIGGPKHEEMVCDVIQTDYSYQNRNIPKVGITHEYPSITNGTNIKENEKKNEDAISVRKMNQFKRILQQAAHSSTTTNSAVLSTKGVMKKKNEIASKMEKKSIKMPVANDTELNNMDEKNASSLPRNDLRLKLERRRIEKAKVNPTEDIKTCDSTKIIESPSDINRSLDDRKKPRCKFWPNCHNSSCEFLHPSKPCRKFPNCPHGNNCKFGHPLCKFNQNCKNENCIYYHDPIEVLNVSDKKKIPCHYGRGCTDKSCQYNHPFASYESKPPNMNMEEDIIEPNIDQFVL